MVLVVYCVLVGEVHGYSKPFVLTRRINDGSKHFCFVVCVVQLVKCLNPVTGVGYSIPFWTD